MIKTPPPPGPVRDIAYPHAPLTCLENGLQVAVIEKRRIPKVSIRLAVRAGQAHCPSDELALIPLAVDLLKEGTTTRSSAEIADLLEGKAIQSDADVHLEHSLFIMACLKNHLGTALSLLSDMIRNPAFAPEELEKAKVRWRSDLKAERAMPSALAEERAYAALFQGHPYSHYSPTPEQLERVERSRLEEYYRHRFVPSRAILVMVGDLSCEEGAALARRHFEDWSGPPPEPSEFPDSLPEMQRSVHLIHRPHSVQARMIVASRLFERAHPHVLPFRVANQVLGGGASARLFQNLREDKGYTYGAYSHAKTFRREGVEWISADVRSDALADAVRESLRELSRMCQSPPDAKELRRALSELAGGFLFQLETSASLATMELSRRLYELPDDYFGCYLQRIRSTTGEQVHQLSRRYLDPQRYIITAVADRSRVEDSLREFGPVQVYDTQGNEI